MLKINIKRVNLGKKRMCSCYACKTNPQLVVCKNQTTCDSLTKPVLFKMRMLSKIDESCVTCICFRNVTNAQTTKVDIKS